MKKSSLFMGALVGVTLTATGALAVVETFSDVPADHWAATAIANLKGLGVVQGYDGNVFKPNNPVSRAEVAVMLDKNNKVMMDKMTAMEKMITDIQAEMDKMGDVAVQEIMFMATMKGDAEVPAVVTTGHGTATFTLADHKLTYSMEVMDLSGDVTGAHIHMGEAGKDGAVVHPLTFDGMKAAGSWTLTDAELKSLKDGMFYVNVHTALNPEGEVRGQIMPKA